MVINTGITLEAQMAHEARVAAAQQGMSRSAWIAELIRLALAENQDRGKACQQEPEMTQPAQQ